MYILSDWRDSGDVENLLKLVYFSKKTHRDDVSNLLSNTFPMCSLFMPQKYNTCVFSYEVLGLRWNL